MAKVAFLGLGVMGFPMAGHLKGRGGRDVVVYNRTAARAHLRGVAIAAGCVLVVERERCAREADAAGLFVYGFQS